MEEECKDMIPAVYLSRMAITIAECDPDLEYIPYTDDCVDKYALYAPC